MKVKRGDRKRSLSNTKRLYIFGSTLDTTTAVVPLYLEQWLQQLESHLKVEGLFRISPSGPRLNKLKEALEDGETLDYNRLDAHELAGLVKMYFRELKMPLFPASQCANLIGSVREPYDVSNVKSVVHSLPAGHVTVLFRLLKLLHLVASHSSQNLMTAENLAIVFAPTLFNQSSSMSLEVMLEDYPLQIKFVNTLIAEYPTLSAVQTSFALNQSKISATVASVDTLDRVGQFKSMIEDKYGGETVRQKRHLERRASRPRRGYSFYSYYTSVLNERMQLVYT